MERVRWVGRFLGGLFVVGAIVAASAWQSRADDQSVGVARISVFSGIVVLQHSDSADKIAAVVNAPVMAGDYITTGADSRTEVQLDDTNFIRAGAQTQLRFTRLDPTDHTVQLAAGTIELSVLRYPEAHPRIQTPSITIRPTDSGRYRVTVTNNGDTLVTVRSGRADLVTPHGAQTIGAGTSVLVAGPSSDPRVQTIDTIAYDDFDAWNGERDRFTASALAATSRAYANSGIVGLADLNDYGRWSNAPSYGSVWIPYDQFGGWSPYRYGRWAWQPYCGWTWVGYEPWGWAPYHYGRWFYEPGLGWAWYPGPLYQPYYWQPALVAFFGFDSTFGNIGWVPLAPFEAYHPWWRHHTTIGNVANFSKTYRNAGAPGGVEAIRGGDLTNGSKYQYMTAREGDLRNVALAKGGLPVAPSNASLRYSTGPVAVGRIAPMSPRFGALPQPALPSVIQPQHFITQTIVTKQTASNPIASRAVSSDPWTRFGAASNQSTAVHSVNTTHTIIGSARATQASTVPITVSNTVSKAQMHRDIGSSAWNRFDSMAQTTPIGHSNAGSGNLWTTPLAPATTIVPPITRYPEPGDYRAPMSPNVPKAPVVYPGAGAPAHGNGGGTPSGGTHNSGASNQSGNGR